ncbi:transcription termination factor NusA [Candidatus Wolfebacteria bacterium RIFOXYD12_FULL_48_21]|uniref:Transcription termination/antitermination protein NusA n=1 Tax=Candidatus Wolfebacteria bacterium RIFOXYD1_FULL_48_65 TaxID=1802561 RepID=A0A1F8E3C9_9BACT|nr:MAG: transcription termination factor NusA [Candidatus Wolfebacteria bacterium RIFOXYD12_FULL_48_21]OGM95341.1 MAG: transcription termination factor NusA [Candidatus Wolfebacteria bacterium RIFOXYD1_FULL_48_65]OGM95921.1 MAG: transcription termination factor NusA [Candidatus Wolfebacteria bacterium RIFOXYD2_FULL_48_11]
MLDLKSLNYAIRQISEEKALPEEQILSAVESAIAAAYKKEYCGKGEIVHAKIDTESGQFTFWKTKTVVDESTVRIVDEEEELAAAEAAAEKGAAVAEPVDEEELLPRYNPDRHIMIEEAREIKKDAELGDELSFSLEEKQDFGRIAAQTAKQVVLQKIREAERDSVRKEYQGKEGEIVSGLIQRVERGNTFIDLGRAVGVMFYNEVIRGERYNIGDRMRFYVVAVQDEEGKRPGIILSRSHPKFVAKLFEMEVPEIAEGLVEIKSIAREPGSRTKMAVHSTEEGIDPIGACVGQRGTRVMTVTNELGNEKIDIIQWHEDPVKFIAAALSPAKVTHVEVRDHREAKVLVPEDQLSLAIGKDGQNARLAARLTGWKIDIRSQAHPEAEQVGGVFGQAADEGAVDFVEGEQAPVESAEE